ncbi:Transcription initiation factor IIE subunit alpha [Golovinomyces cichoracearum]|uniref:Transcription initiation factor IIE subunit alpha n=1 Tax=Golovinomyces cichoracearum TaxID=62708 RepID=A0A420HAJ4_9PEZI|nr:Transcription initiation factor IIE subunit alpha [Golovinomyces cichoracearum]
MELAQSLVRSCMRSFYDTKHILVIDALIIHSVLRDDDLAYLMSMNLKELHKLCGRLSEDRFLAVHTRAEQKGEQTRLMSRTYYYIDYRATIDAIKWRVYLMNKNVQGSTIPQEERKEWFCKRCKSEWTQIEVLDGWDPQTGFLCHKCRFTLTHDPDNNRGGHEQSTRYHAQFRFITDLLPKIDEVIIPENKFDQAMSSRLEVTRDDTNPASETVPVNTTTIKPTAVKGMKNVGPAFISVTLTNSDDPTDADLAAEKIKKEKIALQNAMPVHFTHSTVTGEQVKFGNQASFSASNQEIDKKSTVDDFSTGIDGAEMDEYFSRLKAEQERENSREQAEEDETDEECEEDFEDVPVDSGPELKKSSATGNDPLITLKRSASSSNSAASTNVNSPMTGSETPSHDRPSKMAKIDVLITQEEDESEEDVEFEDV